jgi:DNA-binding transcriptional MerR regulator
MANETYSINELADAAGISRRAVRFYVQEKLLPPPEGAGRGSHYERSHLEQLQRIVELQRTGHALDAIRRIFAGEKVPPPEPPRPSRSPIVNAMLLSRVELLQGVELSYDAARFSPNAEDLQAFQELARKIFRS